MAGFDLDFCRVEHAGLRPEQGLVLLIVQPHISPRHRQHDVITGRI
jgi:hypothetical protein